MLELFGHPFSSYTWKALIPLYENNTPFMFRMIDGDHCENGERLNDLSPQGKFPLLVDGGETVFESTAIIEYLQLHYPGPVRFIPNDPDAAWQVRMLDRFFDNFVMTPVQTIVVDAMRPEGNRNPEAVAAAMAMLRRSYGWLERQLDGKSFACGESFSLADCAAAPSLFYADWVCPMAEDQAALRSYRARLLARPSVRRCVDEARPYRPLFPPGAPDRD